MHHDSTESCDSLQDGSRRIPLTQGKFAIVDAADYEWLSQWKWKYLRAGWKWDQGYAARTQYTDERPVYVAMHRLILNAPESCQVDHINHDTLDNRRSNLRFATSQENAQNRAKMRNKTTSQYRGVTLHRRTGKWQVMITGRGGSRYIGLFANEVEAARAYDVAARELHGDFACLNFPRHSEVL